MRRWLGPLAAAVIMVWASAPALAHTQLLSSDPIDGASLPVAPPAVTLTFSEDLLPGANTMAIIGADGSVLFSSSVDPEGPQISIPWPADLAPGGYEVSYRVVSGDGHPVTGAIGFSFASQGTASSPGGTLPEPMTPAIAKPSEPAEPGGPAFGAIAAVAVGVVAVGAVIGLALRRRRQP